MSIEYFIGNDDGYPDLSVATNFRVGKIKAYINDGYLNTGTLLNTST